MVDYHRAVDEWVAGHRDELVELASALIRFPTPSPPGRNTAAAQAFLAETLAALGMRVERFEVYPGDPDVVGILPGSGGGRSLLFNGHIDVAEVGQPERWTAPPYQPVLREGRLYGRGAVDMKGALAAVVHGLRALRACGAPLAGEVLVASVIGEESGERGTIACLERGYRADLAVVPEPTSLAICGQGGVCTGWIIIESPQTLHDGVRARTIHAGGGIFGASAIEKMAKVIAALGELERHWAVTKRAEGFPPGTTTINPAVIEGGRHPAFIADRCALWITVHFYPHERYEQVVAEVEAHVRAAAAADPWLRVHPPRFRWEGRSLIEERNEVFPPVPLERDSPAVRALAAAHQAVLGAAPRIGMWPSVSDAGWLASAGIPTVVYGPGALEQAHTVDEWVAVDDLVAAARVFARLALDWCGTEGEPAGRG